MIYIVGDRMRMDRYEEDEVKEKQTRMSKNQELYTDVYLNNAYVDISDLKEVMQEEKQEEEMPKPTRVEIAPYSYEEKNYDIVSLVEDAIKNKGDDNKKRSLEESEDIENIIESINEIQREKTKEDTLLTDLMPDSDTTVIEPLEEPILDTKIIDTSILHKDEMSNDFILEMANSNEEKLKNQDSIKEISKEDDIIDESFKDTTKINKKMIFIIIGIILLIAIVVGILIWKKVIKL